MELTKEMLAKAKQAKNAEELLALTKECDEELSIEQAEKLYAKLHQSGELADDELDNVSGGCEESKCSCGCKEVIISGLYGEAHCSNCGKLMYRW